MVGATLVVARLACPAVWCSLVGRPAGMDYSIILILQWLLTFSNEWDYRGYIGVFAPIRKYRG